MSTRPFLFIIFGPSGVGKTTVAEVIAKKFKLKIFSTDQIRRTPKFKNKADYFQARAIFFPYKLRKQFYQTLMAQGKTKLASSRSVILDATFSSPWMWQMAQRLAKQTQARLVPIEVIFQNLPAEKIHDRLFKRVKKDNGSAKPEVHWKYQNRYQSLAKKHFLVNNDGSKNELKKQVKKIIKKLHNI